VEVQAEEDDCGQGYSRRGVPGSCRKGVMFEPFLKKKRGRGLGGGGMELGKSNPLWREKESQKGRKGTFTCRTDGKKRGGQK